MLVRRSAAMLAPVWIDRKRRKANVSRNRTRNNRIVPATASVVLPSKSRRWWTRHRSSFYRRLMRRIFAVLLALAFVCVSLTPPASAMPMQAREHQAHCADMPAPAAGHHKTPAKPMDGQKCCFAAIPPAALGSRLATKPSEAHGDGQLPKLTSVGVPGGNWAADPPPPRPV